MSYICKKLKILCNFYMKFFIQHMIIYKLLNYINKLLITNKLINYLKPSHYIIIYQKCYQEYYIVITELKFIFIYLLYIYLYISIIYLYISKYIDLNI